MPRAVCGTETVVTGGPRSGSGDRAVVLYVGLGLAGWSVQAGPRCGAPQGIQDLLGEAPAHLDDSAVDLILMLALGKHAKQLLPPLADALQSGSSQGALQVPQPDRLLSPPTKGLESLGAAAFVALAAAFSFCLPSEE